MKSIIYLYNKLPVSGKILIFVTLFLIIVIFFHSLKKYENKKEGFQQNNTFLFKGGNDIYDDFYSNIYDELVFNNLKDDYEVEQIIDSTEPTQKSIILDIGCGTGHHVAKLSQQNFNVIGIDNSVSMIKKAKENYPNYDFKVQDALNADAFLNNYFTHITCLYFTIYYMKDKNLFFRNCMNWLMPGGSLILHLVNRDKFDPILPPGNPLLIVSPQKYAKERIMKTKLVFYEFDYTSEFVLEKEKNIAYFNEKFKDREKGTVRKNQHLFYMEPQQKILTMAQQAGFIIEGNIDLVNCGYSEQYLYILTKPT